jgi:multiple sugar transport system permease protein
MNPKLQSDSLAVDVFAGPVPMTIQQKRRRARLHRTLFHVIVVVGGLIMIYPLLWLLASSLKPNDQIWNTVTSLIPVHATLQHYFDGWSGFGGVTFTTFYINTFIYAGFGTILAIVTSTVVAFGFARIRFPGSHIWFGIMLLTLMLPVQIQIIPQYIIFSQLNLVNSFVPLLLPRFLGQAGQAFFIFMIVQFIRGVPIELDEAAEIDGAGKFGIFTRVVLPLIKPPIITSAIFSFYWTWGDFLTPLVYLNSPQLYTISLALRSFADPSGLTDWGAIFAMSFLSLLPVIIVFIAFQRYIVQGVSTSGLKG